MTTHNPLEDNPPRVDYLTTGAHYGPLPDALPGGGDPIYSQPRTFHVDPETGARKETKTERPDLIPTGALKELAEHYGAGAEKYEDHNWRKGYAWSLSYAACLRHLNAFWGGENVDPETGSKHVIAAAWHALTLATYMDEQPGKDDRYRKGEPDA